jgi:hypothetical protein
MDKETLQRGLELQKKKEELEKQLDCINGENGGKLVFNCHKKDEHGNEFFFSISDKTQERLLELADELTKEEIKKIDDEFNSL